VHDLVERMLHATGRRVDLSQPFVDASLPDGSRLHVVIGGITRRSWAVNIRKFLPTYRRLRQLVEAGTLPPVIAQRLSEAMRAGRSILVSGATHAGKTTSAEDTSRRRRASYWIPSSLCAWRPRWPSSGVTRIPTTQASEVGY
jgi:Flp pilus assembly CpaF family ATPase